MADGVHYHYLAPYLLYSPPHALTTTPFTDVGYGDVEYNKVVYNPAAGHVNFTPNPPRTPNLNAMAASPNSIVFDRFYAGSGVW